MMGKEREKWSLNGLDLDLIVRSYRDFRGRAVAAICGVGVVNRGSVVLIWVDIGSMLEKCGTSQPNRSSVACTACRVVRISTI